MQATSLLATNDDPLIALCQHFNVVPTKYTGGQLPAYFDMPTVRDAHMPTHVLAVTQTTNSYSTVPPIMIPVDVNMYNEGFRVSIIPPAQAGTTSPVPHILAGSSNAISVVSLPVVPISVPHIRSLPLLLLFGLGLERHSNTLALRMLPSEVVAEFPNAATMASLMARLEDGQFKRRLDFNQGMWQNVLALDLRDAALLNLIRTAWNITAGARSLRMQGQWRR
ncbi:hypothetical protein K435DRAFT_834606 [Dendrothele bispora CBS 962.96]|uniref:Uncharacterized protein n=1 Tax=Dendrothele bispora (strain CBS 962.96) TaxID=1314807 RepID=A0A4S8MRJ3_DENBC|nr:hypothetical protein K435DRAFT_834606 [Dendrothele bispora CBS 962.96]